MTTLKMRVAGDGQEEEEHYVRLLDDQTFEILDSYQVTGSAASPSSGGRSSR